VQPSGEAPVRRAEPSDHPRVAEALAAAFADDPAWAWLLPYPDRERRQRLFFELELHHLVPERREVWMSEDGSAAAFWGPPGLWSVPMRTVVREAAPMMRVFGRRMQLALRYLLRVEHKHPGKPPHWYLEVIGTVPDRQGQGLGSAVMRPILALCDRDGVGAYLESSSERNRALYERHGFRVTDTFAMPGGGPTIRCMWRNPGSP
jgi:ribosomal protein S18 acetylase RimI-like enzyme